MVEVLDHAPADLDTRQVLALLAVAERASDTTRIGYAARDEVGRRIRATTRHATRVLTQLVDAGLLEVVAAGGGRGKATTYRVPRMPGTPENRDTQTSPFPPAPDTGKGDIQTSTFTPVDNSGNSDTQTSPFTAGNVDVQTSPFPTGNRDAQTSPFPAPETWTSEPGNVDIRSRKGDIAMSPQPFNNPSDNPHHPRAHATAAPSPVPVDDDEDQTPNEDHGHTPDTDPPTRAALDALRATTDRPVTIDHARTVTARILDGRDVRDPAAYVRRAITDDPTRFAPPEPAPATPSERTLAEALATTRAPGRTFDPDRTSRGAAAARAALRQGGDRDA